MKLIAQNPKARHDYELLDTFEAGLELHGGEVKSIKAGEVSIKEAYVTMRNEEAWLTNAYVKPYEHAAGLPDEPTRSRKLLLHKRELAKLIDGSREKSHTVVPLKIGLVRGYIKIEVALARGKKIYDKRATLKARELKREADLAVRESLR